CGYRYFLHDVMGFRTFQAPEDIHESRALDRGLLVHEILKELYSSLRALHLFPVRSETRPTALRLLDEIFPRVWNQAPEDCSVGPAPLWNILGQNVLSDLHTFVERDLSDLDDFIPEAFEVSFGLQLPSPKKAFDISVDRPLEIQTAAGRLHIRGQLD